MKLSSGRGIGRWLISALAALALAGCGSTVATTRPGAVASASASIMATPKPLSALTPNPGVTVYPAGPCGTKSCVARWDGTSLDSGPLAFHITDSGWYAVGHYLHPDPGATCTITAFSLTDQNGGEIGGSSEEQLQIAQYGDTATENFEPGDYTIHLAVSGCMWRVLVYKSSIP
ncbi:MAG: hypothetical protein M3082_16590 [Candidatus Dormibacteraeota bacterium]|nr:hypothetical protein [Candidatus Dormibacteraeota bacterium]